jgi:hypothetical protein
MLKSILPDCRRGGGLSNCRQDIARPITYASALFQRADKTSPFAP